MGYQEAPRSDPRCGRAPHFRPRPMQPAHVWRRACWLGRQPEPCFGPRPSLALNFGPSLRGCSKIPKAFEHFGSNLSVLEAVWKLQKLFKGSRICCICKGCCSWFPEWFEVPGECPGGSVGVWGRSMPRALGSTGGGAPGSVSSQVSLHGLSLGSLQVHQDICYSEEHKECGCWQQRDRV